MEMLVELASVGALACFLCVRRAATARDDGGRLAQGNRCEADYIRRVLTH